MRGRLHARLFLAWTAVAGQLAGCAATVATRRSPSAHVPTAQEFVVVQDGHLSVAGRRFRFVGVNVYSLASFAPDSGQYHCGVAHSDQEIMDILDEVALMGGNVIRLSAYQSFTECGTDFSRLDFIMDEAAKRGLRLIPTLENQWSDCTSGGYKHSDWYCSGYREPYGRYRLSFVEYVRQMVTRYRDEPTVLMWQIMNEAESRTRGWSPQPAPLLAFTAEMSALIKSLDGRHPVCLGTSGLDRPGSSGSDFDALSGVASIDLVEAHDYYHEREAWPPTVARAAASAALVGKPFFIGEVGISSPPYSREERAELISRKLEAAWEAGVEGVLIWSYRAGDGTNKDFDASDSLAAALRRFTIAHPVR